MVEGAEGIIHLGTESQKTNGPERETIPVEVELEGEAETTISATRDHHLPLKPKSLFGILGM